MQSVNILQFPSIQEKSDTILENKIRRYLQLKDMMSEYESIKKELKSTFEGLEEWTVGQYKITGKEVNRKEYTVPACTYWDMRIKEIKK